jgi:hypothetical protein
MRVDVGERRRVFGFERLQEIDDLLFAGREHRVLFLCDIGPFGTIFWQAL